MYDLIDADHLARVEGLGDHGRDARRVDWLLRRFPGRGLSGPITSACRSGGTVTTVECPGLTEGTSAVLLGEARTRLDRRWRAAYSPRGLVFHMPDLLTSSGRHSLLARGIHERRGNGRARGELGQVEAEASS